MTEVASLPVDVSRETRDRLRRYHDELQRWTKRINLIAPATVAEAWTRHIADSAQLWPLLPPEARTLVDLGSGAGLPGLVLAIIAAEKQPDLAIELIEADARKAAFLRQIAAELGLPVQVTRARAEAVPPRGADVVTARALAPLPELLPLVVHHLAPSGAAILPKGRAALEELEAARAAWHFRAETHPSRTDPQARILILREVRRA